MTNTLTAAPTPTVDIVASYDDDYTPAWTFTADVDDLATYDLVRPVPLELWEQYQAAELAYRGAHLALVDAAGLDPDEWGLKHSCPTFNGSTLGEFSRNGNPELAEQYKKLNPCRTCGHIADDHKAPES